MILGLHSFRIPLKAINRPLHRLSCSEEEKDAPKKAFILGLGYVGCALAKSLMDDGWSVAGTCTNLQKAAALREAGIETHIFDEGDSASLPLVDAGLEALMASQYIISSVPPSDRGDPVLSMLSQELRVSAMNGKLKWLGYLSSTGIYGDREGGWVTEDTPIEIDKLTSVTAVRRAKAEAGWRGLYTRSGLPLHTFRLSGIYGPGRSALDTVRRVRGDITSAGADDTVYVSRVHVADIVQTLRQSMDHPHPGLVLNVADDLPSSRYDVLAFASRLLGYERPPPLRSAGAATYQARGGSKRVDNDALSSMLSARCRSLVYPDYRTGLAAIADGKDKDPRGLYGYDTGISAAGKDSVTVPAAVAESDSLRQEESRDDQATKAAEARLDALAERVRVLEKRLNDMGQ